jgi:hypothetical protein
VEVSLSIGIIGQAAGMFAVTNIDDILLLSLYFGQAKGRSHVEARVVVGQYLGFGAILLVSVVGALGANLLSEGVVAYLGLVPLLLGVRAALALRRHADHNPSEPLREEPGGPTAKHVLLSPSPTAATTSACTSPCLPPPEMAGSRSTASCSSSWSDSGALQPGSLPPDRRLLGFWTAGATPSCRSFSSRSGSFSSSTAAPLASEPPSVRTIEPVRRAPRRRCTRSPTARTQCPDIGPPRKGDALAREFSLTIATVVTAQTLSATDSYSQPTRA